MKQIDELLQSLRAAAEKTRLRLLLLCREGELSVSELMQITGQSQPRISRHLKVLVDAGLLNRFREGTHAYYRLSESGKWTELLQTLVTSVPFDDDLIASDVTRLNDVKKDRASRALEFFNRNAAQWDAIRALHIDDSQVEHAFEALWPQKSVRRFLDIGTGTGRILEMVAPKVEAGIGIDMSRDMLAVARVNLERAGIKNCYVRHGNMNGLAFGDESFDLITFHLVLHYAESPGHALREASRVLRHGGSIVVIDFTTHQEADLAEERGHKWLGFADEEMLTWQEEAGLERRSAVTLSGNPLKIKLWPAVKSAAKQEGDYS